MRTHRGDVLRLTHEPVAGAAGNRTAPSNGLQHASFRHLVDDEIGAEQAEEAAT